MSLRDQILNNFWLKILSLLLATLIWFAIHSNLQLEYRFPQNLFRPVQTREFRVPIALLTRAASSQAFSLSPREATIKVRGDEAVLKALAASDIQPFVKLTDVPVLEGSFLIEVNVPRSVKLQEVLPTHAHVEPASPPK